MSTPTTLRNATDALRTSLPATARDSERLRLGDHWLDGRGWVGPRPAAGSANGLAILSQIQTAFVIRNLVGEIVERHVAAILQREPAWQLVPQRPLRPGQSPTRREQQQIAEAEAALTAWWTARALLPVLQDAVRRMLTTGAATLSLQIPPGLRIDGLVPAGTVPEQLGRLAVQLAPLGNATTGVDDDTLRPWGCVRRGKEAVEVQTVDESGQTVLTSLERDGSGTSYGYPLGGRILLHTLRRPELVTRPVQSQQGLLNMAWTMLSRNTVQGGFLERIILNGDFPHAPTTGAGTTNIINGLPIEGANGMVTGYTSPSVVFRDPVSPDTFLDTARGVEAAMLQECHQLHALLSGDAAPSGEARVQALADFIGDLSLTRPAVEGAVAWLLDTALTLATVLAAAPALPLRAACSVHVQPGLLSAAAEAGLIGLVAARLLSRQTAMGRLGVSDVDAEAARIASEQPSVIGTGTPPVL